MCTHREWHASAAVVQAVVPTQFLLHVRGPPTLPWQWGPIDNGVPPHMCSHGWRAKLMLPHNFKSASEFKGMMMMMMMMMMVMMVMVMMMMMSLKGRLSQILSDHTPMYGGAGLNLWADAMIIFYPYDTLW